MQATTTLTNTGRGYVWERYVEEVPPVTEKMLEHLTPPPVAEPLVGERRPYTPRPDGKNHPYVQAVYDGVMVDLDNAGRGGRNSAINQAALKLGHWSAGGHLSESECKAAIRSSYTWQDYVSTDGQKAAEATLKSGWEAGIKTPKDPPPEDPNWSPGEDHCTEKDDAVFESLIMRKLRRNQEERREEHEVYEPPRRTWDNDWQEGMPVESAPRAMAYIKGFLSEQYADNFRVREDAEGRLILMMGFLDHVEDIYRKAHGQRQKISGIQEVVIPELGRPELLKMQGGAFKGVCRLRDAPSGGRTILAPDLPCLRQVTDGARERLEEEEYGFMLYPGERNLPHLRLPKKIRKIILVVWENDGWENATIETFRELNPRVDVTLARMSK